MEEIMLLNLFLMISYTISTSAKLECSNETPTKLPKYHLIEKCHRSKLGIAAKANFTSLSSCKRFGIEKKALALNFSPRNVFNNGKSLEFTCEVLKCPEVTNGQSLSNDTRYDYYSIYARPLPKVNTTCVPATGMFSLLPRRMNYTESHAHCHNISAMLADVTSEQRTDSLAQVLFTANVDSAYVGLKRNNNSIFYKYNGDTLNCITYRAWAPGHPRRNSNMSCVVLTRNRTWKTSACHKKYQPLCELIPGGPYKRGSIFATRTQNNISLNEP